MGGLRKNIFSLAITIALIVALPLLLIFAKQLTSYLSRAAARPANIIVDAQAITGPLPQSWRAIAQGGEEGKRTFLHVRDELRELAPKYVRIDHIYDSYQLVDRKQGKLTFNWSELDQTVLDIVAAGATPFFALSYMPPALSADGTIVGKPVAWNEWARLVQLTVEHYSGRRPGGMGLRDVYYEVWNEPDLFGRWKLYGKKNYLQLYFFSVRGAGRAVNTERFFLGGPAITAPYRNWISEFIRYIRRNNLRLDFISWHRYSANPNSYAQDVIALVNWTNEFPGYAGLPKIISEFGYDAENNPAHDSRIAAAHTAAAIRQLIPEVELAFSFELKDGPSPAGEKYWGRWGIVTDDKSGNEKKPRYFALKLLNNLRGLQLNVTGEGSFVKAIAARELNKIEVLLINYDPQDSHAEQVPVKIENLDARQYRINQQDLKQHIITSVRQTLNGAIDYQLIMPPNSVVLLTLTPL